MYGNGYIERTWKMPFHLAGESEGPAISSQRETVISGSGASIGSSRFPSQVPITGPVVLASHPLQEERQDPCNSVNAWLAIEKDAEIEVATLDRGFSPIQCGNSRRREEKDDGSTAVGASRPLQQCECMTCG